MMQSDRRTPSKGAWNVTGQAGSASKHKSKQSISSAQPATNNYGRLSNGNSDFNYTLKPPMGKASGTGIMEMKRVPVIGSVGSKTGTTTEPTSSRSSKKMKSKLDSASKGTSSRLNYYISGGKTKKPARRTMLHLQERANAERKMMDKFTIVDH